MAGKKASIVQGSSYGLGVTIAVLVTIAVACYLSFEFGRIQADFNVIETEDERKDYEGRIAELESEIVELKQEIELHKTHREIEREAYSEIEASLAMLENKSFAVRWRSRPAGPGPAAEPGQGTGRVQPAPRADTGQAARSQRKRRGRPGNRGRTERGGDDVYNGPAGACRCRQSLAVRISVFSGFRSAARSAGWILSGTHQYRGAIQYQVRSQREGKLRVAGG